ncbi:MAG: histidinol-phosphatase [Thermoguttaceae bacterium]|jgi:histidinol phosphatase-like enzyme (inositol monophosphatase family)
MQANSNDIARRLDLAIAAARQAGNITLEYFRTDDLVVNLKQDDTPVTIADHKAEEYLRGAIASAFPDDGIFGEEYAQRQGTSGYRWILDPIDGTKSFIHGVPLYGTLLGLEYDGQCMLGVIRIPALDECLYAAKGQGAWYFVGHNKPKPARVSQRKQLAKALFVTSEVISFDRTGRRAVYDRLQSATRLTRTWGDCYGYLMVATGRADLMVDPIMALWDAAALLPILEEAGGTFTDWQGQNTIYTGEGIATNGLILSEVLEIVKGY